jgi:hypothetical protein
LIKRCTRSQMTCCKSGRMLSATAACKKVH